jgi:TPR repeat protein
MAARKQIGNRKGLVTNTKKAARKSSPVSALTIRAKEEEGPSDGVFTDDSVDELDALNTTALDGYINAACNGDVGEMLFLADIYHTGGWGRLVVPKDISLWKQWLKKAVRHGSMDAQEILLRYKRHRKRKRKTAAAPATPSTTTRRVRLPPKKPTMEPDAGNTILEPDDAANKEPQRRKCEVCPELTTNPWRCGSCLTKRRRSQAEVRAKVERTCKVCKTPVASGFNYCKSCLAERRRSQAKARHSKAKAARTCKDCGRSIPSKFRCASCMKTRKAKTSKTKRDNKGIMVVDLHL